MKTHREGEKKKVSATDELLDWIRKNVSDRAYFNSEHIVRDLTCRRFSTSQLEDVLKKGVLLETHSHPFRGQCYLILGSDQKGPVHIMCTKQGEKTLVLLYAYRPQKPTWEDERQRNKGGSDMDENIKKCFFCNSRIEPITVGNFDFRWEGGLYVIKNVPAGLCVQCGEKYISAQASRQIVSKIEQEESISEDKVFVFAYDQ